MLICIDVRGDRHSLEDAPEQLQLDLSQPGPTVNQRRRSLPSSPAQSNDGSNGGQSGGAAHAPCHLAAELLETPGAVLTRTHLRELGWERRGIDAIFRALPVVAVDGYARPVVHVEDYLDLIERSTFRDDRVRPMASTSRAPKLCTASNGKRVD